MGALPVLLYSHFLSTSSTKSEYSAQPQSVAEWTTFPAEVAAFKAGLDDSAELYIPVAFPSRNGGAYVIRVIAFPTPLLYHLLLCCIQTSQKCQSGSAELSYVHQCSSCARLPHLHEQSCASVKPALTARQTAQEVSNSRGMHLNMAACSSAAGP